LTKEEIRKMLKIQEELGLKETAFYREAFEEGMQIGMLKGKQEGKQEGERQAKMNMVPLLRRLGLSDEMIAKELNLSFADVQSLPK
ncbi:MAG: Rpn family recombination-promoting nuclease/putative transposase, partial [Chlorobiales bacterium]